MSVEKLAEYERLIAGATEGPWEVEARLNIRDTGSWHYSVANPAFAGPCPCGGIHPPGKLIAWLSGGMGDATLPLRRECPQSKADADFLAAARTGWPATIAALMVFLRAADEVIADLDGIPDLPTELARRRLIEAREAALKELER